MKIFQKKYLLALLVLLTVQVGYARQWTLRQCIDYALENNIALRKSLLSRQSAAEDVLQSQSALLPSLNMSTSHNVTYRPWPANGSSTIAGSYVQSSVDKVYYNGSYGVNANWTVWNGNRNVNTVKLNKLAEEKAGLEASATANSIQEQIAQLYVQILYSVEAIEVNRQSLATSKKNEERGQAFLEVGKMSKADMAQLTAQRAQDEYAVVEAESALRNYKRQLKQLLQITDEEEFDIVIPQTTDEMALQDIPSVSSVYASALESRPEIKSAQLSVSSGELAVKMAKAQWLPTLGLSASAVTNTTSMSSNAWTRQLKTNFDMGAGITLSIPLFDNRQARTAVNKAQLQQQSYLLDLDDKRTTLYSTVESYWLQAVTNQNKFKAAQVSVESQKTSYELLSEQFRLGLKNIVELMTGKNNLQTAQQNELQSKYLSILNIHMLTFYRDGKLQ